MAEGHETDEEKTEEPTPQRREEFKKQGNVFQSKEVASVFMIAAGILVFFIAGTYMFTTMMDMMKEVYKEAATLQITEKNVVVLLISLVKFAGLILMPLAIGVVIAGLSSSFFQVGLIFSVEPLKWNLDKINPVKGFGRLFALKNVVEALKAILKMAFIGTIAYFSVEGEIKKAPMLMTNDTGMFLEYIGSVVFKLFMQVGLALVVLALGDYFFQKFQYEKKLKMTRQELKEDIKQREGDPAIKARIRSIQRAVAQKRMMEVVPTADVIITNPTHIAVALIYERENMPSPKLIAKGAGFIAEKIKETAKTHGIPIVENKPLAHGIYKKLKLGQFIPRDLFEATAEVLAYIYRLKGKLM
jgi:flagellar biosynthetic protein FlhB